MNALNENQININDLIASGKVLYATSKEALSDVTPIKWDDGVLSGVKKVILTPTKDKGNK